MTTLRNIVGGMDLEETLTSRDPINSGLRGVLDEATGKWGIRVNRVELKGIDPPPSIKDSMEKQMRADREKRAVILTAEGQRQAAILTAEGSKQSQILNAEGDRESQILRAQADREASILRAQGEGQAIQTVFQAIHDGQPDQSLLAYQYLQMMPKIAEGSANKVWVIPSEITKAMEGLGSSIHEIAGIPRDATPRTRVDMGPTEPQLPRLAATPSSRATSKAVEDAIAEAESANPGTPAPVGRATDLRRRRPTTDPRRRPTGSPAGSEPARGRAGRPRGRGGRHHQHRGGVGNVDHVPDPAGVRRAPGDRQRAQHRRPGARVGCRASSATGASWPASAARVLRLGARLAARRHRRRRAPAGAAVGGVRRDRAGADPARRAAGRLRPRIQRAVAARPRHRGGIPDHGVVVGVAGGAAAGVYGGYFGAAQGVLLMAILGIGVADSMQRQPRPRTSWPLLVNGVAGVRLHRGRRRRLGRGRGLIALGSVVGGQLGADRRTPAARRRCCAR